MRNPLLSRGALTFFAAFLICLCVALPSREQQLRHQRVAMLTDWTSRHVLYPMYGTAERMALAKRDPRATFSWWRYSPDRPRPILPRSVRHTINSFDRDWSINLGIGGVAPNAFPSKYTFDITATPSCANDYVVYPLDVAGSTTQANIVAFNNLYSGTAGGAGICNRTPVGNDDGVDATVYWSYNVSAVGGTVPTSPEISWDNSTGPGSVLGTKIAFVESAPGQNAHFHVLAFKAGDGQDATNLQNTLTPVQITTFVNGDPAAGSGTATDLALNQDFGGPSSISAPFVDYNHDYAYVGNDAGDLYRIKDVFCPTYNTDAGCTAGAAPSLDISWGSGNGYIEVASGCGVLTGAVSDSATGDVFVGCSDGRIYGYTSTGTPLGPAPHAIVVGDSSQFGGVVVPPIVDAANGFVYAVSGTNGTAPDVMQVPISNFNNTTGKREAALGLPPGENLSLPTFNDAYFSNATSGNWAIFSCGYDSTGTLTYLYDIGFGSSRLLNTGTPPTANHFQLASSPEACAPLTGFVNALGPPAPPNDWLFVGLLSGTGSVNNYNVSLSNGVTGSGGFPITFTNNASPYTVSGGPSGMIPDNDSTSNQASSIYFSSLGAGSCGTGGSGYCAIKLTQSGLQ